VVAGDSKNKVGWAGPDAREWGRMIDAPADLARALVCAAVRETFEECGVLLAGPTEDTVVADTRGEDWEADRAALLARSVSLAGLLRRRGLVLRSDLLRPWARWITPVTEERRYDTRFFAALLPVGQIADDQTSEADRADWVDPARLLEDYAADSALMLPPTVVCLEQVAAATSAAQFLADEVPMMAPITPVPVRAGDAVVIRCTLPLSHMFGRRLPIAGDSRPRSAPLAGE